MQRRVTAVALLAAAALSVAPGSARAFDPDVLPEPLWWRAAPSLSLAEHPLRALRDPAAFRSDGEWAPLYAGRDGARIERGRRSLELRTPRGPWRGGFELRVRQDVLRGGDAPQWLGTERLRSTLAIVGLARESGPFGAAAAVMRDQGSFGVAAEARAHLGTGGEAWWRWSRVPEAGRMVARWSDAEVIAAGRWIDQRVAWSVALPIGAFALGLGQEALDRRNSGEITSAGDRLEPALAWRASLAEVAVHELGARWTTSVNYGEGRERWRVSRDGTPYAGAAGTVIRQLVALEIAPDGAPIELHAWSGRWSGSARGSVALWPFDPLATLAGTRRLALSSGSLHHRGLSVERTTPSGTGFGGGLALCWLAPRASYESWQATLMGLGRSDEDTGASDLRAALALGARLGAALQWRGMRAGVELVQWVPVRVDRGPSDGPAAGSGGGATGGSRASGNDRGGTMVRVSVRTTE